MTDEIKWSELAHFTPKQKEASALVKKYKFVLYGGAMGGGKSYFLRWQLLRLLLEWHAKSDLKNITVALFCEDYPSLKDRHLSKIKFEFPDWLGTFNASDHNFVLRPEYGGGVIAFRNLDDVSKYQSSEFAAIAWDEVTKKDKQTFDYLRTRLRWPGIVDVKFIGGTNPGGIGHLWVRKYWIDKQFDESESEKDQFAFIQSRAVDNPHLDKSYMAGLEGLPDQMKKALVYGSWDIFAGQYFTEWRSDVHIIQPVPVLEHYRKFICGDYGYTAPSAVYWCYKDANGTVFVYRELYGTTRTYQRLMEEILAMTPPNEKIDYMVFDPAIWAKKGETDLSGAEIMQNTCINLTGSGINMVKGNNDRLNGWNVLREYLKPVLLPDGRIAARLQVFNTCYNLIRTLPALIHDEHKVEDVDSEGEDHASDAIRYGLMSRPASSVRVNPVENLLMRNPREGHKVHKVSFEYD